MDIFFSNWIVWKVLNVTQPIWSNRRVTRCNTNRVNNYSGRSALSFHYLPNNKNLLHLRISSAVPLWWCGFHCRRRRLFWTHGRLCCTTCNGRSTFLFGWCSRRILTIRRAAYGDMKLKRRAAVCWWTRHKHNLTNSQVTLTDDKSKKNVKRSE